jgi:hypothetical protein
MLSALGVLALCAALALVLFLTDDRHERRLPPAPPSRPNRSTHVRPVAATAMSRSESRAALATIAAPAAVRLREPAFRDPPVPDLDALDLVAWRREQLVAAGVQPRAARSAAEAGIDASRVRSLVERGCAPELALRIVD